MWPRTWMRKLSVGLMLTALSLSALLKAAPGTSPVADAAQQGDKNAVRALLKQAGDVNAAQGDGMTALHWAAMKNDADLVQMLLRAGANVNATTRINAHTPLILAAKEGHATVLAPLLTAGADVNRRTSNGSTPLMFAAASGSVDAVRILLDHGADVNAKESAMGLTPGMFAAASGRTPVIVELAKHAADFRATTKVVDLYNFKRLPSDAGRGRGASNSDTAGRGAGAPNAARRFAGTPGVDRKYSLNELVHKQGGMTALHFAARHGYFDTVNALLDAGADVNQVSEGDRTSPLLMATINGHFDLAMSLLAQGADPNLVAENGVTPLYAALNCEWASKAQYPQPRAYIDQKVTYLELMKALLDGGANPNVRLNKKVWYSNYFLDRSGVEEAGATPFWRAAYAADLEAMKLLVAHGADPTIPTMKVPGRRLADMSVEREEDIKDVEGAPPPVPVGGPGMPPIVAAAGAGYAWGYAGNAHRYAPTGMLAAVKYLVEELNADVNAADDEGETALHNAASRGDIEMILYLVSKGANVKAVTRRGQTTADYANGPVQRVLPFPEALALLEKLGAKNNHRCVSCGDQGDVR